jgi:serine/threonine-protein kinase/endoribonuclease IRE1
MIGGGLKEPLKKLPFTIPELVAASPCKSSDGILYTGKKVKNTKLFVPVSGNREKNFDLLTILIKFPGKYK